MSISKPLVSIIVVNWNGGEVFRNCLKSLSRITYPNWELILIDNASTDGSEIFAKKIIKKKKVVLHRNNQNLGFAPANNQAIMYAHGKYLLLLNNDTVVSSDFLTKMVNRMSRDETIGVLQPKIYMMDKKGYLDNAGSFFTKIGFLEHWGFGKKDSKEFSTETEIFSAKGACMLTRRNLIQKIGLFDNRFMSYFEESDFCWRVWLSGKRVIFFPEATIKHKVGFTIKRLDVGNINFHYYKNRIRSLIKNLSLLNLVIVLPIHLVISFGIATAFTLRGNPSNGMLIVRSIYWNIKFLPDSLKERSKVQKLRRSSDGELFANTTRSVNFVKFFQDFKRVEKDIG